VFGLKFLFAESENASRLPKNCVSLKINLFKVTVDDDTTLLGSTLVAGCGECE
jgi:hypothetical protein